MHAGSPCRVWRLASLRIPLEIGLCLHRAIDACLEGHDVTPCPPFLPCSAIPGAPGNQATRRLACESEFALAGALAGWRRGPGRRPGWRSRARAPPRAALRAAAAAAVSAPRPARPGPRGARPPQGRGAAAGAAGAGAARRRRPARRRARLRRRLRRRWRRSPSRTPPRRRRPSPGRPRRRPPAAPSAALASARQVRLVICSNAHVGGVHGVSSGACMSMQAPPSCLAWQGAAAARHVTLRRAGD